MTRSLFHLPAELVRQIMHALDPASFYICLQTSKVFRDHALNSKTLLQQQLALVPGLEDDSQDAHELLLQFRTRAARHLVCGVPQMADVHVWKVPRHIDRKMSKMIYQRKKGQGEDQIMVSGKPIDPAAIFFVGVCNQTATIQIYTLASESQEYSSRPDHVIAPQSLPRHVWDGDDDVGSYRVLKIAQYFPAEEGKAMDGFPPDVPRLAVLYGTRRRNSKAEDQRLVIVIFVLDPLFGPITIAHYNTECSPDQEIVSMAVSDIQDPVILYCTYDVNHGDYTYTFTKYMNVEIAGRQQTESVGETTDYEDHLGDMYIQRHSLFVHSPLYPLAQYRMYRLPGNDYPLRHIDTSLPDISSTFNRESLGLTLATYHHCKIVSPILYNGRPTCINSILQLAVSRDKTTEEDYYHDRTGAFLMKAVHFPDTCTHFDHAKHHMELDYTYVANLRCPPDLTNLSTLGLKIAISPAATRIAIASWRTVKIWPLNPQAFLDPRVGSTSATRARARASSADDFAYSVECGWDYYRCWDADFPEGMVGIEPVSLPCEGVVYDLGFWGEDEVWGWTEGGLCRWRVGVGKGGIRVVADEPEEQEEDEIEMGSKGFISL